MTLGEYLKLAAGTPWQDGVHDCTAWPARWAGIELPADYALHGRTLIEAWAAWIRLPRAETPEPGDIGVIEAVGRAGITQVGAIYTGKRWAFLTERGLACASANPLAVWRVACPRQ